MKQLLLLAVALLVGTVVSQPCAPQPGKWMSPLNLQGPRYNPQYKPLHVFSFLDGGEDLVLENTGDSVSITYPIRPNINSSPPNLTDIQISKGPLADHYTADHVEFRWGPAVLPVHPSSSTGAGSGASSTGSAGPDSSSTGTFFLEVGSQARAEWGSDHAFSGRYFPLEMQIFFYNTKYKTYAEALAASPQEPDHRDVNEDVVALSVLFEVGAQNEELVKITDRLDNIQTSGATTPILAKMCFEKILNKGRDFITYPGSLTRAPCTRGVRWIVLVETLTVSQSQLDQFRLINLDAPEWLEPLDQPLFGRLVETNLKELPLDDKFIPAFHPHGPPLNVIDPKVGGTVINEFATDAEDAAYKNYWSPFDYTIVDDAVTPPVEATAEASTTEVTTTGGVTADTAEPPADTAATAGGGGATGDTGLTAFMLAEQGQTAATAATGGGGGGGGGATAATVLPAPTADGTATDESSTGNAAQQPTDKPVKIPNFFHLSTVAYFTPDFAPRQHRHQEDNHYHPPSLGDPTTGVGADSAWMPDTEESFKGKKEAKGALNPAAAPAAAKAPAAKVAPLPQLKQKVNKHAKAAAAKPAVAVDPKTAFLKGKRPAQK